MPLFRSSKSASIPKHAAVFAVAALVLAGCGAAPNDSSTAHSHHNAIATASIPPSSVCGSDGDNVSQSLNGDFTACVRVPALHSSSLVVALQAYLDGTLKENHSPTTTTTAATPTGHLSLTLSSKTATPGESVTVTGHYSSEPPTTRASYANLCWDGCEGGLQEDGAQFHWTSAATFKVRLLVPETAWLVRSDGVVSVHPLQSGSYSVGIECIQLESGCALGRATAHTTIQLNAPAPKRCGSGQRCETMQLSTTKAQIGDVINLKGWAPLQLIIGRPFSYSISITAATPNQKYYPLSYSRLSENGGFSVVLTPRVLRVVPGETWANLGRIPYLSSTFAGPSPIEPEAGSALIAWCLGSGLVITGGPRPIDVPSAGAVAALRGTNLTIFSSQSIPQCESVLLDPKHPSTVYAGFDSESDGSAPPVYVAALYTTNDGATWRTVPPPPGTTFDDFGGFTIEGNRVLALFAGPDDYNNRNVPQGTTNGLVSAEVTSNGGASWTSTTLGCPSAGPCTTLGPFESDNCGMNPAPQPLLLGPAGATASSGVRWTSSTWVTSLDSCVSPQLVVTSPHDLMVLDPSTQYPMLQSIDSGTTWSYVALPSIPGTNNATDGAPPGYSLLLAPDGSLFVTITTPSGQQRELYRLDPTATSWCRVPRVFGSTGPSTSVSPLRLSTSDLLWSESTYPSGANPSSTIHEVTFASLRC
jgi:hypothetical protein